MNTLKKLLAFGWLVWLGLGLSTCSEPEKPKPEIMSVSPVEGPEGQPVAITGKNLATAQSVLFGTVTSSLASKTETQILTVVPPGLSPGTTSITVKGDGGTSNTLSFLVLPSEPEITSITPNKGSVGMELTLAGKHLNTTTSVSVGTKSVTTFLSKSDTELKFPVPEGLSLGAVDVTVTTDGGTSEKSTFTVVGKPVINSLTPAIGPVGKKVSIAGSHFDETSKVFFGTGEATFELKTNALIEATVPETAVTGKVKVITPGGEALSANDFVVKDAPKVTSFSPPTGLVGALVTINGEGFDGGSVVVKFGAGTASSITVVNATKITATVPATATTGKITVQTAAGSGVSATNFTVIGAPSVASFLPTSGGLGVEVVITGTNFVESSVVKFNSTTVSAANYTFVSATQVKAKVPAGAASGKISVTTPAGTGNSANNFTVLLPPEITSFSPGSGALGSNVIITGTGFSDITSVKFNEVEVGSGNFSMDSPTQITAKVPGSATNGKIKVANAQGTSTSANTFYVTPFISAIDQTSGPPGITLTITGTNLASAKVTFNVTEATPITNTNTQITVLVPSISTGAKNVAVVNLGGTSNTKTFTVTEPVILDEIIASKNIKGQLLLCIGSNLLGATKVLFGAVEATVLTNTAKVVGVIIPNSLSVGTYTVKVVTNKGTSNGKTFEVLSAQTPNTGGVTLANGATIAALPPGYVPPISNQWDNLASSAEQFSIQEIDGGVEVVFKKDGDEGVFATNVIFDRANNYIEFTINGVRYVGSWIPGDYNAEFGVYCYHHITLISSQSGMQLKLRVPTFEDGCP